MFMLVTGRVVADAEIRNRAARIDRSSDHNRAGVPVHLPLMDWLHARRVAFISGSGEARVCEHGRGALVFRRGMSVATPTLGFRYDSLGTPTCTRGDERFDVHSHH
jgi:hypothetical protein